MLQSTYNAVNYMSEASAFIMAKIANLTVKCSLHVIVR